MAMNNVHMLYTSHFYCFMAGLLFFFSAANAQPIPENYLNHALEHNLVLKQKKTALDKSLLGLKEARSLFLPTSWIEGQYTLANGGRTIDIPIGDLMNPVYETLNQLTGSTKFPTVSNVSEQFLPNNFYDLRLKTTMPLVNPDIKLNSAITARESTIRQDELNIYKRELVKDVKVAYYNYVAAKQAVLIYEGSLQVVKENLRTNETLLRNGTGLPAYVTRAESELQQVQGALDNSRLNELNARAYFNFLLNRPLTEAILVPDSSSIQIEELISKTEDLPVSTREELKSVKTALEINSLATKMHRSFRTPRVNAFVDLASQGFDFNFNSKTIFYLGGIQMQVPIFTGKRNLYKIRQSAHDATVLQLKEEQLQRQLEVAVFTSRNGINAAYTDYRSSRKQQLSAQQYFRLIDRGYKEGVNSFIEFLDARDQLTRSQLQHNISFYKVLSALAEYERQTASYSF
jgi:outer membrane protein